MGGALSRIKQAASSVVTKIKQAAKTALEVIDNYMIKPYKSKDNFK
jgi:hypothetical protein